MDERIKGVKLKLDLLKNNCMFIYILPIIILHI